MGIKSNWNKFLRDTCPNVFNPIHVSEYSFKKVAIDISLYLHKYKASCGDKWLSAFINLISCLRRNEIHCVFIFDGKAPVEKKEEQVKRRDYKEKMDKQLFDLEYDFEQYEKTGIVSKLLVNLCKNNKPTRLLGKTPEKIDIALIKQKIQKKREQMYQIDSSDFQKAKELFTILNVPYYTAPWEAEKMCSKLCIDGLVSAVLSEDTDVMAYSSPMFLTKIDVFNDTCIEINHDILIKELNLEKENFLDLCIMCGTDYNTNIPRVGSKTAYKYILQHKNIDNIGKNTKLDISVLNHYRVRYLFTNFEDYNIKKIPFCGKPNFVELKKFIEANNIQINFSRVEKDFTRNIVLMDD